MPLYDLSKKKWKNQYGVRLEQAAARVLGLASGERRGVLGPTPRRRRVGADSPAGDRRPAAACAGRFVGGDSAGRRKPRRGRLLGKGVDENG